MRKEVVILLLSIRCMVYAQVPIAQVKKASADFLQTRVSIALNEPVCQKGHFQFIAPDSIEWRYNNLSAQLPEQMLSMIKQTVSGQTQQLEQIFLVSWDRNKLTLRPKKKQMQRFFSEIMIDFSPEGVAKQVLLTEPTGDTTTIEFMNMKYSL